MIRVYTVHYNPTRVNLDVVTSCPSIAQSAREAFTDNGLQVLTSYDDEPLTRAEVARYYGTQPSEVSCKN